MATNPHERIRAGLEHPTARPDSWRPDPTMEALAALPAEQLSPKQRMALGFYKAGRPDEVPRGSTC